MNDRTSERRTDHRVFTGAHRRCVLGTLVGLLLLSSSVWAADHRNLEEENPIEIEDAFVIAFRSVELQPVFRYEDDGERDDIFLLEPEVKWGFIKNGQVELRVPFFAGSGERERSGDINVEALYNFNVETRMLPAAAFRFGFEFPSGEDSRGVNSSVKGILTKGINRARFHLNAGFTNLGDPGRQERDFRYKFVLGTDHPLDLGIFPIAVGLENLVIFDVVAERSALEGDDPLWTTEVGIRHQINPWALLTLGAGAGLSGEAPDYVVTLGFQYTFAAFEGVHRGPTMSPEGHGM